jgi:two-component system, NarL family, invasion response regulator UvrY
MLQILIVDDHAIVRRGLRQILTDEPDLQVSETGDAHDAFRRILERPWDLVVLDLDLPGKSGLDLLKEIRQERPRLPVLILSVHLPEQFAVRTLRAGASGFLSKDAAPDELVTAIRQILRGGKYITEPTAERLLAELNAPATGMPHDALSDREFQILRLLGAGKTVKAIATELSLSVPTVSTYRARVLQKLGLRTTAEVVRYAIEHRVSP